MFKKITGVPLDKEDARSGLIASRDAFREYKQRLVEKKQE